VFAAGPKAQVTNFNPGDIGYVKRNNGHWVKNTGNTELQFLEVFKVRFSDVSLSGLVDAHTARDGRRNLQHRPGGDREVVKDKPRVSADPHRP
jgi:oxalate decarboxylase